MKKVPHYFLLLVLMLISSKNLSGQSMPVIVGPDVATQFMHYTYSLGNATGYTKKNYIYDIHQISNLGRFDSDEIILLFLESGTIRMSIIVNRISDGAEFTIYKDIQVQSNPLIISMPENVCPFGTQIGVSEISPHMRIDFLNVYPRGIGNVSSNGFLTYPSSQSGEAFFSYNVLIPGYSGLSPSQTPKFQLRPHELIGSYYYSGGALRTLSQYSSNYTPRTDLTIIEFDMPMSSFSYELLTPGNVIGMRQNAKKFEFRITDGDAIFRFTFDWGCCTTTENIIFTTNSSYNISTQSGLLSINKEQSNGTEYAVNKISKDRYEIIDANTGIIKKNGLLTSNYNQIDASGLSNGLYVVRVISGDHVQTEKITIKN